VLWLCGRRECNLGQVASYIIDFERNKTSNPHHYVLYFFCVTTTSLQSNIKDLVIAFLQQLASSAPLLKHLIVTTFLRSLAHAFLAKGQAFPDLWSLADDSSLHKIQYMIEVSSDNEHFEALKAVFELRQLEVWELCIVVDGLDNVVRGVFIRELRAFIEYLMKNLCNVKALFTSLPQDDIKLQLEGLPFIEYDKERKGSAILFL
jgi:hypothetical protein